MAVFPLASKGGDDMDTIIGPSVHVEGKMTSEGNVILEGQLSGSVSTTSDLKVGTGAKLVATVEARNAVIAGEVQGNINVRERLELEVTAKVVGDVEAKTISVAEGAVLQGKCTMLSQGELTDHKPFKK